MMTNYLKPNGKTQSRTGKIARLPHSVREELNRQLMDNVAGAKICKWVNRLPAAREVCAEFARRSGKKESPINERQLSEWRRGGFRDWLREQRMLEDTREMARWSVKLAKDAGGELSEGAAVLLSGQLLKLLQGMAEVKGEGRRQNEEGPHPGPLPSDGRGESCSNVGTNSTDIDPRMSLRVADPRSGSGEAEGMESTVRVLGALVKCLSGIRNGDHNRVRLAQVERKLAQRDKMIALDRKKYDDEQAEIAAEKKAEEKMKRAEKKEKISLSGLSDRDKIHWLRGRLFGPERVIKEKEEEIKQAQKDLALLKEKLEVSEDGSDGGEAEDGGGKPKVHPPSSDYGATGSPKSNVASVSGPAVPSEPEHIRALPSSSYQSQEKNRAVDGSGPDVSTQRREDAKAQGEKKFDVKAMLRETRQTGEELAALREKLPVREGSSNGGAETQEGSTMDPPSPHFGATGDGGLALKPEFPMEEPPLFYGGIGTVSKGAWEQASKKFEDWAVRRLAEIKKELAAHKADLEANESSPKSEVQSPKCFEDGGSSDGSDSGDTGAGGPS